VGCPAAVAGGRRGAPVSGEVRARAVAHVAWGASAGARGLVAVLKPGATAADRGLQRWRPWGEGGGGARRGGRAGAAARGLAPPFKRLRSSLGPVD
jgi:hypothetical protein